MGEPNKADAQLVCDYNTQEYQGLQEFFGTRSTTANSFVKSKGIPYARLYSKGKGRPRRLYSIECLEGIKDGIGKLSDDVVDGLPEHCIDVKEILDRYDIDEVRIGYLFSLIGLKSEVRFRRTYRGGLAKGYNRKAVETAMSHLKSMIAATRKTSHE